VTGTLFYDILLLMDIISNFIVFEGGDGSGTTTQLSLLSERFKSINKPLFIPTYEPTDGPIGKIIRSALKKELTVNPKTLAYLFAADRNEHLYGPDGIIEKTKHPCLVASDRYVLSSLVYQGIECGDELPNILNSRFGIPELTIFLDIDPQIALARMNNRSSLEIYEYHEFQEKVREKYKKLIETYRSAGARVEILDASKKAGDISEQVWSIVSTLPIFNT